MNEKGRDSRVKRARREFIPFSKKKSVTTIPATRLLLGNSVNLTVFLYGNAMLTRELH